MLSNPRTGLVVTVCLAMVAALWLIGQVIAADLLRGLLFPRIGYAIHAVTFLAVFALAAAIPVALLFRRYAQVKAGLLSGRDVVAHWTVDPELFHKFAATADQRDHQEKRGALVMMAILIAVVFAGFALFDPDVAPAMLAAAAAIVLVLVIAYRWGERVRRIQLQYRTGEVFVGHRGLLNNGVLHVWDIPLLSRLSGAAFEGGRPGLLTVSYVMFTRAGPQVVNVLLPVPPGAEERAQNAARRLMRR